jgi:peptidoglycan/xylan/chitin deacetylase (PgdA/CDA1 family)
MAEPRTVFLMYHELELPARPLCQSEPGYVRYILPRADFQAQMQALKTGGWQGLSVGSALAFPTTPSVAITFDDGCETDLLTGAPILRELNFGATFYVTAGYLGRQGYMSPAQLRELSGLGFEIGCHSMSHPYLTDLKDDGLHHEIVEAKLQLEQILGKQVEHFSCPGGRYSQRVLDVVRRAGYRSVANSEIHTNSPSTDVFALGRVAMLRGTSLNTFREICSGHSLWKLRTRDTARNAVKRALGNRFYDGVRAVLLGRNEKNAG